jgi:hypothetical protein
MQTWKLLLLGTVLGAAVVGVIVPYNYNPFAPMGDNAIAASRIDSRPPISAPADLIAASKETRDNIKTFDSKEGWGPFSKVDW